MRFGLFQIAILLLAAVAAAEDEPWNADPVDVDALAAARKKLSADLKKPKKDAPPEEQAMYEAVQRRIALLSDFETAARSYFARPAVEESDKERERLEQELADLRKQGEPTTPKLREAKDIGPLEEASRKASAELQAARKELSKLQTSAKDLEKGVQKAIAGESDLKSQIAAAADAEAGSLQAYRKVNAQIELRLMELFKQRAPEWRKRAEAGIKRIQASVDLASEQSERASKALKAGRDALQKIAEQQSAAKKKEADELAKQADREQDPLVKFLTGTKARVTRTRSEIQDDEKENTKLRQQREAEKTSLKLYERENKRVQSRVESRRVIPAETAEMLHATLMRVKQWRPEVVEQSRPRIDKRIHAVLREMGPLQDEYWSLEVPPAKLPAWSALSEELAPERQETALQQFTEAIVGAKGLRAALRDRVQSLETEHELLNEIDSVYEAQIQELLDLDTFITGRIYWVKTDDRLGRHLFDETGNELGRLWAFYTEPEFVDELKAELSAKPYVYGTAALMLIVLLLGAITTTRRLRAQPMGPPQDGEHLRRGIHDGIRTLIVAIAPSLVLVLGAALIRRLELPARVSFPAQAGLDGVAFMLFVQRLAWGLLFEGGFLVVHFKVKQDVGAQILRSVRLYTLAGMIFWVPSRILEEAPFDVDALSRLFGTGFRVCELLAVALLLPRTQPVARAFVGGSEGGLRVFGAVAALTWVGMALVVLMDLLGYRYGATFFTEQIMETALVVLILRGLYSGLNQISGRVTERVRERAFREQGGTAAWEDSSLVTRQLTRLITVGTIVAAALFLAKTWDFSATYGRVFEEWKLTEVSEGVFLTAADLISAIVWVAAAHFVSSNIAGIFELIVFPIFGKVPRGTRFVVLALSRYLILIIGYSAALVSVHFSVANLGWLFAAISVGLGFGLQEIVANFVSGLILLVEQPVRVGDVITVGDTGGTVDKITIRATIVNDWDQKQIIIPNKAFITQNLINWTRNNNFTRRKIAVNVAYGSDVEKVLKVLDETVKGVENVRSYPPPRIWFDGFGEYAIEFMVWIYVDIDHGFGTMSNTRKAIFAALQEAGIQIPFPQREIRIKSDETEDLQGAAGLHEEPDAERPAPES
ncbi:MAG: mechanosensitive ion channel domain-containing protein [Planctomycetota bacterium]